MEHDSVTETRLQELYGRALSAREGGGRERCASPEAMRALSRREGSEESRLETLDHVMACAECGREFELLRSIARAGEDVGAASVDMASAGRTAKTRNEVAIHPRARSRWRLFAPLAIAASALVVAGIGVARERFGLPDISRGAADAVTLLAPPNEVVAGAPVILAWRPVQNARRYEVEVLDDQGAAVFTTVTSDTTVTLGESPRLTPGSEYRWWVRATNDAGGQRASPTRRLRVRAP